MKERPILFSGPMVRAILGGSKTQTRRIIKPQPPRIMQAPRGHEFSVAGHDHYCPYGQPGDRLWVREAYALLADPGSLTSWDGQIPDERPTPARTQLGHIPTPIYRVDGERPDVKSQLGRALRWRPGIHMPRWASRITLEVTGIRVERLQDISEEDAQAEGVEAAGGFMATGGRWQNYLPDGPSMAMARESFRSLWEKINGPASWAANPWVWVVSFRRIP